MKQKLWLPSLFTKGRFGMSRSLIIFIVLIFATTGIGEAVIVELPLDCTGTYDHDNPYWETDFDLGVEFTEISGVYIDWRGEITGGLVQNVSPITFEPIGDPRPVDTGIEASLGFNPSLRITSVRCGSETYPDAELFDLVSEIDLPYSSTWSDILDGKGKIVFDYSNLIILYGYYIERGKVVINDSTLIIEGTIVPEPATVLLFCIGAVALRKCKG